VIAPLDAIFEAGPSASMARRGLERSWLLGTAAPRPDVKDSLFEAPVRRFFQCEQQCDEVRRQGGFFAPCFEECGRRLRDELRAMGPRS
jgi:hypothetical protein